MERVTMKKLIEKAEYLNDLTLGSPDDHFTDDEGYWTKPGAYTISGAYSGYCLHRFTGKTGGVADVLGTGHIPARELLGLINAFIAGYRSRYHKS